MDKGSVRQVFQVLTAYTAYGGFSLSCVRHALIGGIKNSVNFIKLTMQSAPSAGTHQETVSTAGQGSLDPAQLIRSLLSVRVPQAFARWRAEHAEMGAAVRRALDAGAPAEQLRPLAEAVRRHLRTMFAMKRAVLCSDSAHAILRAPPAAGLRLLVNTFLALSAALCKPFQVSARSDCPEV